MKDVGVAGAQFVSSAVRSALSRPRTVAADAYYKKSLYRRWRISAGDRVRSQAQESGFAIRLFRGDGRVGHAFASGSGASIPVDTVLDAASYVAERCTPGVASLPPGQWEPPDLDLFDPAVDQVPAMDGLLLRLETAILEEGGGEVTLESMVAVAGISQFALATSAGFSAECKTSLATFFLHLRARRGSEVSFHREVIAVRHLSTLDADRVGRRAARRARLPLGAGSLQAGSMRIAFEPQTACVFLEHLAPSLEASAARRGGSAFPPGKMGGRVASSAVGLVDDPCLRRGIGSLPFDGEGRPTRRSMLIDQGILGSLVGARNDSKEPVGAALRRSFTDPPRPGPSNLHFARGERSPANIVADYGSVFRVTAATLLGRGGPASGEIVLSASGELLESGEPVGQVRDVTLVGRMDELLAGVLEVGNDLQFHLRGTVLGSPTLVLDGMWIP